MSMTMEDGIKRWTAKRKSALVVEIIQGKTTVAEASRSFDLAPSEIEGWIEDAKKGMENALRANPLDIKETGPGRRRAHSTGCKALPLVWCPAPHGLLSAGQIPAQSRSRLCRANQGDDRARTVFRLSHGRASIGVQ